VTSTRWCQKTADGAKIYNRWRLFCVYVLCVLDNLGEL